MKLRSTSFFLLGLFIFLALSIQVKAASSLQSQKNSEKWNPDSARWGMEVELSEWSLQYLMPWFDFEAYQKSYFQKFVEGNGFAILPKELFHDYFTHSPEILFQFLHSNIPEERELAEKLTQGISLQELQEERVFKPADKIYLSAKTQETSLITSPMKENVPLLMDSPKSPFVEDEKKTGPIEILDAYGKPFGQNSKIELPAETQYRHQWDLINDRLMKMNPKTLAVLLPWKYLSSRQKARLAVANDSRHLRIDASAPELVRQFFSRWSWNTEFEYMEFRHREDFQGVPFPIFIQDVQQLVKWAHVERQILWNEKNPRLAPASLHYHTSANQLNALMEKWDLLLKMTHADALVKKPTNLVPIGRVHSSLKVDENRMETRLQVGNFLEQASFLNSVLSSKTEKEAHKKMDERIHQLMTPESLNYISHHNPLLLLSLDPFVLKETPDIWKAQNEAYQLMDLLGRKTPWNLKDQQWILSLFEQPYGSSFLIDILIKARISLSSFQEDFLMELSRKTLQTEDLELIKSLAFLLQKNANKSRNGDSSDPIRSKILQNIKDMPEFSKVPFGLRLYFSDPANPSIPSPEILKEKLFQSQTSLEMESILEFLFYSKESSLELIQEVLEKMLQSNIMKHFYIALEYFKTPAVPYAHQRRQLEIEAYVQWRGFLFLEMIYRESTWPTAKVNDLIEILHKSSTDFYSDPVLWIFAHNRLLQDNIYLSSPDYIDNRCLTTLNCKKLQESLLKNVKSLRRIPLTHRSWSTINFPGLFSFSTHGKLSNDVLLRLLEKRQLPASFWSEMVDRIEVFFRKHRYDTQEMSPEHQTGMQYILRTLTSKYQPKVPEDKLPILEKFLHQKPIQEFYQQAVKMRCDQIFSKDPF